MTRDIDWTALAAAVRATRADPREPESHGARLAVELLIGEAELRRAIDDYVAGDEASGLIRAVLALVRPPSAMTRCHEIHRSRADVRARRRAVDLLRAIADRRVLSWIEEFLKDPDESIRASGIWIVDELLREGLAWPEECEQLLRRAETHNDSEVRTRAVAIRERLARLTEAS